MVSANSENCFKNDQHCLFYYFCRNINETILKLLNMLKESIAFFYPLFIFAFYKRALKNNGSERTWMKHKIARFSK